MAIKIGNLSRWARLEPGQVLTFGQENRQQRIRVEFNVSDETHITAIDHKGHERFVAVIQGHETIEFTTEGDVVLVPTTEGEIWWYTRDGDTDAMELVHEVPFTRVMQRRARNPELELMMFKMNQNIERRIAAEVQSHIQAQAAMAAKFDPETGEVDEEQVNDQDGADDPAGDAGVQPGAEVPAKEPAK